MENETQTIGLEPSVAVQLVRLAVAGGIISPGEGFLAAGGTPISTTINLTLVHNGNLAVTRFLQNLFGPLEAHARQRADAATNVHRPWLESKLVRGGADLVNREVYDDGRQERILASMVPFLALKRPCFYVRNPGNVRMMLQAFGESFDRKVLFNYTGSELIPSVMECRKKRSEFAHFKFLTRILKGQAVLLPATRSAETPRVLHPKAGCFFELSKTLFERLLDLGHPDILDLLQQTVIVDVAGTDLEPAIESHDAWPAKVQAVIERRTRGAYRPLIDADFRQWETEVEGIAQKQPEIAEWLAPFFDLPGKLLTSHLLMLGSSTASSPALEKWAVTLSRDILKAQGALLKVLGARRVQVSSAEEEAKMLQRLENPRTFRDLVRSFSDQRKRRHWPLLARLLADGKVIQLDDPIRYVTVNYQGRDNGRGEAFSLLQRSQTS